MSTTVKASAKGLSKEEISRRINDALEIRPEIDFTKLSKEELERFAVALSDSKKLVRLGVTGVRKETRDRILGAVDEALGEREGGLFGLGIIPKEQPGGDDKGPLGLGILPRVKERLSR